MASNPTVLPVILSGGAGTRLWPVSREQHPKPFLRLADGQSLLQKAYMRAAILPGVESILTVTNRELFFKTQDEYSELGAAQRRNAYILEPLGRNTAAAVAAAALWALEQTGPQTTLLILAADHLIAEQARFAQAVGQAVVLAGNGKLVTFGIQPGFPETGYGYIEADGNQVRRFVEKPDLETAKAFVADGRHLWNSGMFCFRADALVREMERHAPQIVSGLRDCLQASQRLSGTSEQRVELDAQSFERVPEVAIDVALMER